MILIWEKDVRVLFFVQSKLWITYEEVIQDDEHLTDLYKRKKGVLGVELGTGASIIRRVDILLIWLRIDDIK